MIGRWGEQKESGDLEIQRSVGQNGGFSCSSDHRISRRATENRPLIARSPNLLISRLLHLPQRLG
jgi:hypothetical protein